MEKYAVVLAGGAGLRAGGEMPKQFQILGGLPVLWWSVKAFHEEDPSTKIRIVMHPGFFDLWDILYSELPAEEREIDVEIVCGGSSRIESVKRGILGIGSTSDTLVAVHDAARPLISPEMIGRGWIAARENGAAVPVVPMIDSIRHLSENGSTAVDRSRYVRVQTPQVFYGDLLKKAYEDLTDEDARILTDDASVVERLGHKISLYDGEINNLKITNPIDFAIAGVLIGKLD
ncbi:MAG: 2-C-methyl-D-erythritol 4-phosphate cytidylyltransferase [Muribaculaceae bacterium]|nr:2-C-methyl-D-erythritol 4-phosphate cytidylyltransferase [Muribaculaceae bacterium]